MHSLNASCSTGSEFSLALDEPPSTGNNALLFELLLELDEDDEG